MDLAAYQAAGLYDPDTPGASDRRALLEHLEARGVSIEQMLAADAIGSLHAASTDIRIRPGPVMPAETLAAKVGVTPDLLRRITLAAGLAIDEGDYRDSDAETFTRAVGSSMARVADAAISLFLVNVEGPIVQQGGDSTALAEAADSAVDALDVVPSLMAGLFRLHMQAAINRQRIAGDPSCEPGLFRLAVGFVDLVGFTPYAQDVSFDELAGFVESFEARANDIVAARGGRVVKHIGDEVMFIDSDPGGACDIALELAETFGGEAGVVPHAGIGFGPLVARGGDYYGPVVNVASRIADLAVPGEVLVTAAVEEAARDSDAALAFEPAGRRSLKGFAEPVPLWSVTRPRPAP